MQEFQHDPARRTGRTTRMLFRALCELANGKRVIVVCSAGQVTYIRHVLRDSGLIGDPIQFVSLQSLIALQGLHRDRVSVFVDHYVREVATYVQHGELINAAARGLICE